MKRPIPLFITLTTLTFSSSLLLNGCTASNQTKGAGIGAVIGAGLGAALGDKSGKEKEAGIAGAVIGGVVGGLIGKRMDQQAEELQQVTGVEDVSVDKTAGQENIEAKMKVQFDVDKADIKPQEAIKLDELANVFAKYPENKIVIEGHTDSDGKDEYNQKLSERRAAAIEMYLKTKELGIASLTSVGYGESQPVAPNDTPENKARNRRVEIKIAVDTSRIPSDQQTLQQPQEQPAK